MFFDYLTGGQVVAGSNPAVPTNFKSNITREQFDDIYLKHCDDLDPPFYVCDLPSQGVIKSITVNLQ